jgi:zinc transporter ZupT
MDLQTTKYISIAVTFLGSLLGIMLPSFILNYRQSDCSTPRDKNPDVTAFSAVAAIRDASPASDNSDYPDAAPAPILDNQGFDSKAFESDWFFVLRCVGSGSILSVGLLHTLVEGSEMLGEVIQFPLGNALCLIGAITLFCLDQVCGGESQHSHSKQKAIILDLSVAVHSFIIGLTLGIDTNATNVQVLTIAFFFHQLFEGIPIGVSLVSAGFSQPVHRCLIALFVFTVSTGILVGMAVQFDEDTKSNLWTSGALNSFVSGNLIYIGLVEMLNEDFHHSTVSKNTCLKFKMFFGQINKLMWMCI